MNDVVEKSIIALIIAGFIVLSSHLHENFAFSVMIQRKDAPLRWSYVLLRRIEIVVNEDGSEENIQI